MFAVFLSQIARRGDELQRKVVRKRRKVLANSPRKTDTDQQRIRSELRQKSVVKPAAASQTPAVRTQSDRGDQCGVDLGRIDRNVLFGRQNLHRVADEFAVFLIKAKGHSFPIDAVRQNDTAAVFEHRIEHRENVDFVVQRHET